MDNLSTVFLWLFFINVKVYGYMVGIIVSLCYWKKHPLIPRFALAGFTLLLLSLTTRIMIDSVNYVKKPGFFLYFPYGTFHTVFRIIGWSFIVYAVFGKRKEQPEYRKAAAGESVDSADRRQEIGTEL